MNTKSMYNLKETLCSDLDQYAKKGSLTRTDLDTVNMITNAIKNIEKITAMEEEGYSYGMGDWTANGNYSNGMPMNNMSYGRRMSRDGGNYHGNSYGNDTYNDTESRMRREMNY